jgi:hypothetical protein
LREINLANYTDILPYKEEVTGSNTVAPTRVFQKSLQIYTQKTPLFFARVITYALVIQCFIQALIHQDKDLILLQMK